MRSLPLLLAYSGLFSLTASAPTPDPDDVTARNIVSGLDADTKGIIDELVPPGSDLDNNPYIPKREESSPLTLRDGTSSLDASTRAIIAELVPDARDLKDNPYLDKREAGLYWGPIYIGNLKLYLTNPHVGYAGPKFPNANHVNFHVDKKAPRNKWDEVVNMHIVKYTRGGKFCLYAWDSVTKKVVFDNCFDNFLPAIKSCVEAVKNFVDTLLRNADWIASILIIAALIVVLVTLLTGLAAVAVA